jgi:glucosylceramidase
MKTNGHYAMAYAWSDQPPNGMTPDKLGKEGQDFFIQEDRYFDAYARYFRRYVEDYAKQGIKIGMVMPQNEFNSAQPFPSCCWTPEGLARFIPFLGHEMAKTGTEIFFGTLERPSVEMLSTVMKDAKAGPFIKGVGIQWGGKGALEDINRSYPHLPIWGSEQECGRGTNDWHYTRYSWDLIKRYFNAGAGAWHYWNMAMPLDGLTGWGWPQNALVSVDTKRGTYTLTNDYWLMKHLSAFVQRGARLIPASSFLGFENQLAFRNPNGDVVVVIQNDLATPHSVGIAIGGKQITPALPADSFNTIVIPTAMLT